MPVIGMTETGLQLSIYWQGNRGAQGWFTPALKLNAHLCAHEQWAAQTPTPAQGPCSATPSSETWP